MQDRPTAVELLQVAREFCERDLIPALSGRVRFHARVLQNVLGILEREWANEEEAVRAEWDRLGELLGAPDRAPETFRALVAALKERNADLAARIRSGEMDDRWDETVEAVYEAVAAKLAIANPGYSETSTSSA